LEGIEGLGEHGSCEDNEDEDEEPVTTSVVLLEFNEDDGFIID